MPITLVMSKISYEDKTLTETLQTLGFGYEQLLQSYRKTVGSFAR